MQSTFTVQATTEEAALRAVKEQIHREGWRNARPILIQKDGASWTFQVDSRATDEPDPNRSDPVRDQVVDTRTNEPAREPSRTADIWSGIGMTLLIIAILVICALVGVVFVCTRGSTC